MSNKINEQDLTFSDKPLSEKLESANIVSENPKVKIFDSANVKVVSKGEQHTKKIREEVIDKIMLVFNIVTNIAFLFFISDVLDGVAYDNGLYYIFNAKRIVGIIIFAFAQITGLYLFVRAFKKGNVKTRLILTTAPLSFLLLIGLWVVLNLPNFTGAEGLIVKALGLSNFDVSSVKIEYIIFAVALYLVVLYLLYSFIFKKSNVKYKGSERKK